MIEVYLLTLCMVYIGKQVIKELKFIVKELKRGNRI